MKRVFELDVLECDRCGGRMRILAAIHSAKAIQGVLEYLDLPSRVPPIAPAVEEREQWDLPLSSGGISACDPQKRLLGDCGAKWPYNGLSGNWLSVSNR